VQKELTTVGQLARIVSGDQDKHGCRCYDSI